MKKILIPIVMLSLGSGCALFTEQPERSERPDAQAPQDEVRPVARPGPASRPPSGARTADALDTTTDEERQAASAPAASGARDLGVTVASLGDPARSGFWLETPLVSAPAKGRVEFEGQSAQVDLIPIEGPESGGSRISLSAMRLIGAPLTGLPEVRVSVEG
ncbi:hypothetical protein [Lacimonas salitolerans]|uniref:D-galactarate dehydratase n=1 Tax=Lacimonas salitolerans TaxID=1323750 RepID=A0ABW4EFV3_9RHOB